MGHLFALLVGCDYVDSGLPVPVLEGAENDAKQFAALLAGPALPPHRLAQVTLLLGPLATRARIQATVRAIQAAQQAADTLLFYFAGHGGQGADGLVLYAYDSAYPATQLLEDCGTDPDPLAFVFDTCHSGAIAASESAVLALHMTQFSLGQMQFLCSAAATQPAHERANHGVFTQTLLGALAAPQEPSLWALPLPLDRWCTALPPDLLNQMDYSLAASRAVVGAARAGTRDVDGPGDPSAEPAAPTQLWPHDTQGAPPAGPPDAGSTAGPGAMPDRGQQTWTAPTPDPPAPPPPAAPPPITH